jgi:hypothetical protein
VKKFVSVTFIISFFVLLLFYSGQPANAETCCDNDTCAHYCSQDPHECSYGCIDMGSPCFADPGHCSWSINNHCTKWCACGPCVNGVCGQACCDGNPDNDVDYQVIACGSDCPNGSSDCHNSNQPLCCGCVCIESCSCFPALTAVLRDCIIYQTV